MTLLLDPNSVVVPATGWIYVFNRKGLTKIQANQIDEVHRRVARYLDGTYEQKALISAVPIEKRSVLQKYFEAMSQAGALHSNQPPKLNSTALTVHERVDSRGDPTLLIRVGDKTVFVALSGWGVGTDARCDARLLFLTPDQMNAEWSYIWRLRQGDGPHLIYVIVTNNARRLDEAELSERRRYAVFLLGCLRFEAWTTRAIQLYSFDRASLALTPCFVASLNPKAGEVQSRPELISTTDHPQIPLVTAKASVPFCSHLVVGCGLHFGQLSEQLKREFIVRVALASESRTGKISVAVECEVKKSTRAKVRRAYVDWQKASQWPVAESRLHVRLRALESFQWRLQARNQHWRSSRINLMLLGEKHPQIAHLIDILQVRRRTLPAALKIGSSGLYVCELGEHRAYSFFESKAIRDVLLDATKDAFYGESLSDIAPTHESDFDNFSTHDELERMVLRQREALHKGMVIKRFLFKQFRRYGITAWIGNVVNEN